MWPRYNTLRYASARLRGDPALVDAACRAAGEQWKTQVLPYVEEPLRALLKRCSYDGTVGALGCGMPF